MPDSPNPYAAALAALERDLAFYRQQVQDTEFLIASLRPRVGAMVTNGVSPIPQARQAPKLQKVVATAAKPKRGETTGMVLDAVRQNPGRTSLELVELIAPRFTHLRSTREQRKLVSSILGHLRDKTKRIKQVDGLYYADA